MASVFALVCVAAIVTAATVGGAGHGAQLRVLFTGEAACELDVCDCDGKMLGGVGPWGGFIAAQEGEHLLVDTGCMGCGARRDDRLRLEAMLRAMAVMGYDAANVGEYELWLGKDLIASLGELGVPLVSANVTDSAGEPLVEPCVFVEKAGLTVAVTGVVASGVYRTGPGLEVDDPFEALARVVPSARERADVIVVLADLRKEDAREVALRFPEAALVLFRGRGDSLRPEIENRSVVASVSGFGRYVGEVRLDWKEGGEVSATGTPTQIDKRFRPDRAVLEASIEWYERAQKSGASSSAKAREDSTKGADVRGAGK
jgi:2',3'-cyclic-nucleotide 2'-phosphodiesterase (5'-nucleotidase family)